MAKERGIWGCMRTFVFHLQHTLRQMSARCPHPNRGRWHASRRWWITRAQNTSPSKVSIVIFCHLFSHWTNLWGLTTLSFYDEHGTNCVKITYLKSLIPLRYYCVDLLTKRLLTHIAQALLLTAKPQKQSWAIYYFWSSFPVASHAAVELARPIHEPSMERAALLNHPLAKG